MEKLKQLRGPAGQISAAKRAGISQQMWSKLESGRADPEKSAAVIQIARKYHVTVESLLEDGPLVYTDQVQHAESIGARIWRIARDKGHSEAWLRKTTGMPQEGVRRMIDESIVEAAVLVKLIPALGVPSDAILFGDSPPKSQPESSPEAVEVGETEGKGAREGRKVYGVVEGRPELRKYERSKGR